MNTQNTVTYISRYNFQEIQDKLVFPFLMPSEGIGEKWIDWINSIEYIVLDHHTLLFKGYKMGTDWTVTIYNNQILVTGRKDGLTKEQFFPLEHMEHIKSQFEII